MSPTARARLAPLLATVAALAIAGAAATASPAEGEAPAYAPAYEGGAVTGGGTLLGVVRGPAPAFPYPDAIVTKDGTICGSRKSSEALIRAADGAIRNAVVSIEGITKGKPIDLSATVSLVNSGCRFVPHVVAMSVGQRISIVNGDPILHNTHAYLDGTQTIFNIALPVQNQKVPKTIRKPGIMSVQCDAGHAWMTGWIHAFDHPYFAVTDEKGSFRIDQIPPGRYRVTAWQEELGTQTQEVTIAAGGESTLAFDRLAKPTPSP
ncbi:MAG: carboxypeptidase regulatory-like domain-containing protein [Acidobacteria bacterium]|nr:carboxypeptidase regulatory-like domain-containing protein [Acidobacteriota bacterium]